MTNGWTATHEAMKLNIEGKEKVIKALSDKITELESKVAKFEGLTRDDWVEIYYALIDKQYNVEAGNLAEGAGDDLPYKSSDGWAAHLGEILDKIGPDGENMYAEG